MTAPKAESVTLVQDWINKEIADAKVSVTGDYVTVDGSVNAIEKLLKTQYNTFGKQSPLLYDPGPDLVSERGDKGKDSENTRVQPALSSCRPC